MSDVIVVSLVSATSTVLVALIGAPWLRRIHRDVKVAREQTENSHQDAEFPNLREQLDVVLATTRAAVAWGQASAAESRATSRRLDEHEADVLDIVAWARRQMGQSPTATQDRTAAE
ncbi:MAG: hypothetical protein FWF90_15605 [Promicromonosporaceae bacterium]|nr:hypothetical protein [Promicromonosporaceae bacterium]